MSLISAAIVSIPPSLSRNERPTTSWAPSYTVIHTQIFERKAYEEDFVSTEAWSPLLAWPRKET